jgi:hypothetical protein
MDQGSGSWWIIMLGLSEDLIIMLLVELLRFRHVGQQWWILVKIEYRDKKILKILKHYVL